MSNTSTTGFDASSWISASWYAAGFSGVANGIHTAIVSIPSSEVQRFCLPGCPCYMNSAGVQSPGPATSNATTPGNPSPLLKGRGRSLRSFWGSACWGLLSKRPERQSQVFRQGPRCLFGVGTAKTATGIMTDFTAARASDAYFRTRFSIKNSIMRSWFKPPCPWSGPTWSSKPFPAFCRACTNCIMLDGCTLSSADP